MTPRPPGSAGLDMNHICSLIEEKERLDELYSRCNRRSLVHPDPLEFLYHYPELRDRELAGLIAASLAYGRVRQILKSVSAVLERMNPSPFLFLVNAVKEDIVSLFSGFRHRFTSGEELSRMLCGMQNALYRYGSLQECFAAGLKDDDTTVLPALSAFIDVLTMDFPGRRTTLLPSPANGSACKRPNLFLRWMVRRDMVDPGGWDMVPARKLIIPLDTHIHRIGLLLNLTDRRQANMRTAIQITQAFRTISPEDPVRYDFALSRLGIRSDMALEPFVKGLGKTP